MKIKGTIKQIAKNGRVHGESMNESMVSALVRFGQLAGFAQVVGTEKLHVRGKASDVWEITVPKEWEFTMLEDNA